MPSKPNRFCTSDDLKMLAGAFKEVCNLSYGTEMSPGQAAELGTIILDLFSAGETDPEVLKSIALKSISRQRPH
jgi:hypothetical protein